MIEVTRLFDGLYLCGERYAISVQPVYPADSNWPGDVAGTLALTIDAKSTRWSDDWARLAAEQPHTFTRDELELVQTGSGNDELRALHVEHADLPGFRTGFALALEPGMRAVLETELPRVERVTRLAADLCTGVEPHLGRTLKDYARSTLELHEVSALLAIAAKTVLEGYPPPDALRYAVLLHDGRWAFADECDDPQYVDLGAALRKPDVIALLEAARPELPR